MENGTALAVTRNVTPLDFSSEQSAMIRATYANGASEGEFAVLMEIAKARRLNPLLKQIHFVKRYDSMRRQEVWSCQASIDGLRAIAERTGNYDGQDEPEFVDDDKGNIVCAKVRVYRKDWKRPAVGIAYWSEYVQTTKEGQPTRFWKAMPHVMLAKCAEALALRKAFPEDTSGLYTPEEMQQADNGRRAPAITADGEVVEDLEDKLRESIDSEQSALCESLMTGLLDARDLDQLDKAMATVGASKAKLSKEHLDKLRKTASEVKRSFQMDSAMVRAGALEQS